MDVRRIPYGECDKVELNVLEGYTLKAKLETGIEGRQGMGSYVYVEKKQEDGSVKACLFDVAGLQENSQDAMERIAYAAVYGARQNGRT